MNALSKFAGCILIVLLLVIIPIREEYSFMENLITNNVNQTTYTFSKNCRVRGYINKNDFDNFRIQLAKSNRRYKITITYRRIEYYPLAITDKRYTKDKPYVAEYYTETENQIIPLIRQNKDFQMEKGDDLTIRVADISSNTAYDVISRFLGRKPQKVICSYGGTVE